MSLNSLEKESNLSSLKVRWAAFSFSGSLILSIAFAGLHASWGPAESLRWLLPTTVLFSSLCLSLWRGLAYNYRAGESVLLPTLGAGNQLTLVRGLLVAMLAGFLLTSRPTGTLGWLPGFIMGIVVTADLFDGFLARRTNQATRLGEMLDMQLDALSMLISTSLAVLYLQAPAWFLLVGLARFLFLAGIGVRRRLGKPVYDLPPSASRRPFAGAMMGFAAVLLFPVFSPPATHLAAALFTLPFLAGFTRDWLYVSGAISANPPKPDALLRRNTMLRWLPVALRVILVAGLVMKLANIWPVTLGLREGLSSPGAGLISGLFLAAALLLAAGVAGRVGAAGALVAFGLQARINSLGWMDASLIIVSATLFFLGSGALSAWTPEDRLIEKRLGEKLGMDA